METAFFALFLSLAVLGLVLFAVGKLRKVTLLRRLGGTLLVSGALGALFGWLGFLIAFAVLSYGRRGSGDGDDAARVR
jgi:hypothetical protein